MTSLSNGRRADETEVLIHQHLRQAFQQVEAQPLPSRFTDLLQKLKAQDETHEKD